MYRIAVSDYLLTGMEANLGFLNVGNPEIIIYDDEKTRDVLKTDLRLAIINYLEKRESK
jgi:hypothetical protein